MQRLGNVDVDLGNVDLTVTVKCEMEYIWTTTVRKNAKTEPGSWGHVHVD
jgi:hypothetical protein